METSKKSKKSFKNKKNCQSDKTELEQNCLAELKQLIRASGNENLQEIVNDDQFLLPFVIGRKFNVKKALETATNHMDSRSGKHAKLYAMPASNVQHVLNSGFFGVLKHRDQHGRLIGFMRIPKLDIYSMEFPEIMRAAILLVDYFFPDREVAEKGQVFIIDYTGYNLEIFRRYSFSQKLDFCRLFLNNYPTKFKSAHIYNNPRIFSYTYSCIKPFLPEKLRERIYLHAQNLSGLHELISPEILPEWMGGKLSDEEAEDRTVIQNIINQYS